MTYRQLGYWDNLKGRQSLVATLHSAEERQHLIRYIQGWQRANRVAWETQQRRPRKANEPIITT